MTSAREAFLERLKAADALCSGIDLQDVPVAGSADPGLAGSLNRNRQFYRRGVMVGAFAAFEDFVQERTRELSQQLTLAALPAAAFPDSMINATRAPAVGVLQSLMSRESAATRAGIAVQELAAAWSSEASGAAWTVPHLAFLWPGSNLSSASVLNALSAMGTASEWGDITGVVQATGVSVLPTKAVFEDIAKERHKAAHDAKAMVDIIALSPIPKQLMRLGFAVDALLSVGAARIIQRSRSTTKGRQAVELIRLVHRPGSAETWAQYAGASRAQRQRAARVHVAPLAEILENVSAMHSGPESVLCVMSPDAAGRPELVDWRCLGV